MKPQVSTAALAAAVAMASSSAVAQPPAPMTAVEGEPRIEQMVVFRDGSFLRRGVRAERTTVKVGRRTCVVAAATPLTALLRTRTSRGTLRDQIGLRDYGACSRRPADSAGLFVKAIRGERNKALNGWVYKVGRKLATAGAADPAGPFGSGRLRTGQRIAWFYCVLVEGSCQRSLEARTEVEADAVSVTVTGYDDAGEGRPIAGARVSARRAGKRVASGITGADGRTTLTLTSGVYTLVATREGLIRSFPAGVGID